MKYRIPVAILRTITSVVIGLAAFGATTAVAGPTYYFPGSNINYTGGSNSYPLNTTIYNKCQFLYKSTDFNSVPSGAFQITTIYIKPSTTRLNQTISGLTIKLGNTSLTTLSSGSWVSGLTTVYSPSSVTISTSSGQWLAFTLTTPFVYTGGNLMFEISQANTSSPGISLNHYTVSGRNGRKYGRRTLSTSTGVSSSTALFGFDGVPAACSGTPQAAIITTAAMSSAAPLCAGSTKSLSASNPNGAITGLSYQWQSAASSAGPFTNVTGGSGATTLNYTTPTLLASIWYRVGIKCSNSGITSYSAPYQVIIGAQQPGAISGPPTFCPGDAKTYSVPAVTGHTYTWTLPTGWTGTSTTNSILVTPGSNAGTISVTANGCGGTSIASTRAIVSGSAPGQPTAIAGANRACANAVITYSTPAVSGASSYSWILPTGWTGSSTSNAITVTTSSAGGNVKVKANNGCGSSAYATKNVSIISSLPNPGTISTNAVGGVYCAGALYSFSISPVPGATSYVWSLPSGWTGTNSGTSIQAFAGSSGQVKVTAYVSCATSPTASLSATVRSSVTPSVTLAPNAGTLCQGKPITFTATPTNGGTNPTYIWKKNGASVLGSGNTYLTSGLANGDVVSVAMASNALCRSADTSAHSNYSVSLTPSVTPGISINSNPVITICDGTKLDFRTIRTGGGSAPGYQWYVNGAPVTGADDTAFTTTTLANGDTVTVVMTTNAVCATAPKVSSNKVGMIVNPVVHPDISVSPSSALAGQAITFTATQNGGGAAPAYQWVLNNVDIPGASGANYTSSGLAQGDRLSVRMLSYAECAQPKVVASDEIIVQGTTSIVSAKGWSGVVHVYPNPNNGHFIISAEGPDAGTSRRVFIEVYNVLGQRIYQNETAPSKARWNYELQLGESAPSGHYNLHLSTSEGASFNIPFLLSK